ncbi:related to MAM33 - mitochondrial acidic matrix protein [Cephalotrichum gorgonifer]|uniref:Related to MAM33 - mitochondrial acidic matrix protein n=1 Tax=Cephalotrichum gorgonifer TaxID=2041049 RepID=A0AAE8SXW1_9PEZI|nr:related to MAM33 - mitochondrial acidic matrix protein [Cephalotrichum gorgonifer]
MLSLRNLARAAPRVARLSAASPLLARQTFVKVAPVTLRAASAFSTARVLRAESVDSELSAKLASEIEFEEEVSKEEQMPASIRDFIDQGNFEVIDIEGKEEVRLVRNFGSEKITVSFSVTELPYQDEELAEEDQAFDDAEPAEVQQQNARAEEELEGEEDEFNSTPTHLTVVVEKPSKGPGAISIECTAQEGAVIIDNVHFYADAAQAFASSPEASHARVDAYPGPSFATLDEDLQVLLEQFLEERGVGEALGAFVPDYVDYKEQKEYQRWLKNVKNFIDL